MIQTQPCRASKDWFEADAIFRRGVGCSCQLGLCGWTDTSLTVNHLDFKCLTCNATRSFPREKLTMGTLNLNGFLPGSIAVIVEVETRTRSETVNALETWKAPSRDACQEQEKSTKLKKKSGSSERNCLVLAYQDHPWEWGSSGWHLQKRTSDKVLSSYDSVGYEHIWNDLCILCYLLQSPQLTWDNKHPPQCSNFASQLNLSGLASFCCPCTSNVTVN